MPDDAPSTPEPGIAHADHQDGPDVPPPGSGRPRGDLANLVLDVRIEIATLFGFGRFPIASGTIGSAVTLPVAFLLARIGDPFFIACTIAVALIAIWSAHPAEAHFRRKDPHDVVIDEVAGQMVALALVPLSLTNYIGGFLMFRFFDIVKPFPVNRLEKLPGGYGIVCDDLAAGLYANLVLQAAIRLIEHLGGPA